MDKDDPKLLSERQVAEIVGLQPETLRRYRHKGTGPKFVKVNGWTVRYRRSAVDAWLRKMKPCQSTSEYSAKAG